MQNLNKMDKIINPIIEVKKKKFKYFKIKINKVSYKKIIISNNLSKIYSKNDDRK
jgi:hypothetical protein